MMCVILLLVTSDKTLDFVNEEREVIQRMKGRWTKSCVDNLETI